MYDSFIKVEKARLDRESSLKRWEERNGISSKQIYNEGVPYERLSNRDKYVMYKLNPISKVYDGDTYNTMKYIYSIVFHPSEYQLDAEESMFEDIWRDHRFFSDEYFDDNELKLTVGDVIMYFAEKLSWDADMSLTSAVELLLGRLGVIYNDSDQIDECINDFIKSDEDPNCLHLLFGPELYDYNSQFYCNERYLVPSWLEQYNYFICCLIPEE